MSVLDQIAQETGGFVTQKLCIVGNDGKPIWLADIVGSLTEFVDVEKLQAEMPNLTTDQIRGAIRFFEEFAKMEIK